MSVKLARPRFGGPGLFRFCALENGQTQQQIIRRKLFFGESEMPFSTLMDSSDVAVAHAALDRAWAELKLSPDRLVAMRKWSV